MEAYLTYLEKAGMIVLLQTGAHGINALGKPDKVYLDNTNLPYNLSEGYPEVGTVRETFFYNQMRVGYRITSSTVSDFEIEGEDIRGGR